MWGAEINQTLLYMEAIAVISYENLQLPVKYRLLLYRFTSFTVVLHKKDTVTKFLLQ